MCVCVCDLRMDSRASSMLGKHSANGATFLRSYLTFFSQGLASQEMRRASLERCLTVLEHVAA